MTMNPMSHTPLLRPLVVAAVLVCSPLATLAQNDALVTKRPATLRDAPADTAGTLASLPAQTALTRLPVRQGAYVQVRTANGTTGWMHLFDVSSPAEQSSLAATATGALRGLSNLFARSPASATPTATVGIRGLGAEDIANAQPNTAALAQMEAQRQDANQARSFAASAALQAQTVEPLPVPAPPATPAGPVSRRMEGNN